MPPLLDHDEFAYMQYRLVCPGEKDEGDYDDASIDGDNDGDIVQWPWCIIGVSEGSRDGVLEAGGTDWVHYTLWLHYLSAWALTYLANAK